MAVGILAFGSMAGEPGAELAGAVTRRIAVQTPFAVEFARSSRTRDGAPTLVPVREGGAHVPQRSLSSMTLSPWPRRVPCSTGGRPDASTTGVPGPGRLDHRAGGLRGNQHLPVHRSPAEYPAAHRGQARRARGAQRGRPGRRRAARRHLYLQQQKRRGLVTPLMPAYEEAVLERTAPAISMTHGSEPAGESPHLTCRARTDHGGLRTEASGVRREHRA